LADRHIDRADPRTHGPAAWHIPISAEDLQALTAPDVVARGPYLGAILLMSIVVWWFGRRRESLPNEDR
jgi:hypothetical protein